MKITGFRLGIVSAPLHTPFRTALRQTSHVQDVVVELYGSEGLIGRGSAPPITAVTGETLASIETALKEYICPALLGEDAEDMPRICDVIDGSIAGNGSARAAAQIAAWDLHAQRRALPLCELLGGSRGSLTTDITISVNEPEIMAKDAANAAGRGFETLKIKVGEDPSMDVERLKAVRAAAPLATIRIDANQAWKPEQAIKILNELYDAGLKIELVEQPVRAKDIDGLKAVTDASPIPVMADESVFMPQDALKIMQRHAADYINIKLMKCAGISNALEIISLAEKFGVECMMGCMLESNISVTAAAHLACAKAIVTRVDLDGPLLCSQNPVLGGARFDGSHIELPDAPGLGISGVMGIDYLGGSV